MKIISFGLAILFALNIPSCGGNVDLDNAGEDPLTVIIDAQKYVVPAGDRQDIKLEEGYHKIQIKNQENEVLTDTIIEVSKGGLINLAGGEYFIWRDVFSPLSTLEMRQNLLNTQEVVFGNQTFDVEFDTLKPEILYTEQTWDYRLEEDFPQKVRGWEFDEDKKYMFKTKLVRKDEFVDAYLRMSTPE